MPRLFPTASFILLVLAWCPAPVLANGGGRTTTHRATQTKGPASEGARRARTSEKGSSAKGAARRARRGGEPATVLGRRGLTEHVQRAMASSLTPRTVDAQGRTIRRLAEGKPLSLADRRGIAEEAVRQRLQAEGRALDDGEDLRIYTSVTDPALSTNPITGDGLVTVHAHRPGKRRTHARRQESFLVHVSPGGTEVRIVARYSDALRERLWRIAKSLRVNELVKDVLASKGVREALGNFALGGAGLSAYVGSSESVSVESLTNGELNVPLLLFGGMLFHRTVLRPAIEGVQRRQMARSVEAVRIAIEWAKQEGVRGEGFPTLGDVYARYTNVLETLKENKTKALDIGEFAEALARQWNGVTLEGVPGGS